MTPTLDPARDLIDVTALSAARVRTRPTTPTALGRRLMGTRYRTTPTVAMIGQAFAEAVKQPDGRLIISVPPREAKSTTVAVLGTVFALASDPETEMILASYADNLAQEHGANARALIAAHGDALGIHLADDRHAVGRWRIAEHRGGLLATGVMAGITGKGADLLILDDVVKNAQEADSETHRRRVLHEFRSTLMTRIHPGASVIIIGVRWHPGDLIGTLLAEEPERWTHISVPAVAETGIPDTLHRPVGQTMTSAVGRTPVHFADLRRSVGERTWYAEFQGVPASPEGNVIRREWLDQWRLPATPTAPLRTVVGVDPSDSGYGDACGIVAASLTRDGMVVVHRDISEPMTPERWARAAAELAQDVGASEIAIETFTAREGYLSVVNNTLRRYRLTHPIRVTSWPPKGDTTGRGRGDALVRSTKLVAGLENGTVRIAGYLPTFEEQAVRWQGTQHQPDCISALTVAHDVLVHSIGQMHIVSMADIERRAREGRMPPPPAWMRRRIGG
ncbi:hypothetical protein BEL07_18685 [Mycolicibacterium grossiae]|uniref:Terminase large subunit gp17-like C-terminal domain-containing protein n=1 Tax=Mycolicibacterium grossiae TaxID=1552759 RepID=A0A1E8Q114_9MYCO|nr:terminase family protein [Mycolicibacterium grossiae]OFJ52203.1 hypothetical protein BEL07_18685 [Mycolicibacterium grossiae]